MEKKGGNRKTKYNKKKQKYNCVLRRPLESSKIKAKAGAMTLANNLNLTEMLKNCWPLRSGLYKAL
jgi:hypothetical protein